MTFKDHFSGHAERYSRFRPKYPDALFGWLSSLTVRHERAWDCGTGNGQAAVALAGYFAEIVATDLSEQQIAHAEQNPRVKYRVAAAENSGIESQSVDLAVVAQALHWFDLPAFYAEVRRVVRPEGVLAVWCYELATITPAVDAVVRRLYRDVVGPFWPAERRLIEERFVTIPFPFSEIEPPAFTMLADWSFDELVGYLGTWSAVEAYRRQIGTDPVTAILAELRNAWGEAGVHRITWPLHIRVGRIV